MNTKSLVVTLLVFLCALFLPAHVRAELQYVEQEIEARSSVAGSGGQCDSAGQRITDPGPVSAGSAVHVCLPWQAAGVVALGPQTEEVFSFSAEGVASSGGGTGPTSSAQQRLQAQVELESSGHSFLQLDACVAASSLPVGVQANGSAQALVAIGRGLGPSVFIQADALGHIGPGSQSSAVCEAFLFELEQTTPNAKWLVWGNAFASGAGGTFGAGSIPGGGGQVGFDATVTLDPAWAALLTGNLHQGVSFYQGVPFGGAIGTPFELDGDFNLAAVSVALARTSIASGSLIADIRADDNGQPGATVVQLEEMQPARLGNQLVVLRPEGGFQLLPGPATYWVVLSHSIDAGSTPWTWVANVGAPEGPGSMGPARRAGSSDGQSWIVATDARRAIAIRGVAAGLPEPVSLFPYLAR